MALYIYRVHRFTCDEDCSEWSQEYLPDLRARSQILNVRKQAEADGWSFECRRRPGFPYFVRCPRHTQLKAATS